MLTFNELPAAVENILNQLQELQHKVSQQPVRDTPEIMNVTQVAEYLSRTPRAIYSLVSAGKIPYSKPDGTLVFERSEILRWVREHRHDQEPAIDPQYITSRPRRKREHEKRKC